MATLSDYTFTDTDGAGAMLMETTSDLEVINDPGREWVFYRVIENEPTDDGIPITTPDPIQSDVIEVIEDDGPRYVPVHGLCEVPVLAATVGGARETYAFGHRPRPSGVPRIQNKTTGAGPAQRAEQLAAFPDDVPADTVEEYQLANGYRVFNVNGKWTAVGKQSGQPVPLDHVVLTTPWDGFL
ncbi:hypothetical protein [Halosimplex carlsbadense]|nr:hypothetical protein [Halosimplex carlsbadense]